MDVRATGTTAATGETSTAETKGTAMDREAFLKLLVAQIKNQDPLKPMEGTEFVAQLSQFAVVEQAITQTKKLDVLSAQMGGLANNEAIHLVGKTVELRGSKSIAFDGVSATSTNLSLDAPAARVTATIKDAEGNVVRTLELGPRPAGTLNLSWDGKDDSGAPVSAGSYTLELRAQGANDTAVGVTRDVSGVVTRVTFENGYPEVVLDTGARAPVSDLTSVREATTNK